MYVGTIRHRRFGVHGFRHRVAFRFARVVAPPADVGPYDAVWCLSMGRGFNPVRFYYCYFRGALVSVVAEVTNTPWGERHAYVLPGGCGRVAKELHVSPFMGMDHEYVVRAPAPGETLAVHIESVRGGVVTFDATLRLRRRPLRRRLLLGASLRTLLLIYSHAVVLKLKRVPVHPHPA